jgi:hypothetical protein
MRTSVAQPVGVVEGPRVQAPLTQGIGALIPPRDGCVWYRTDGRCEVEVDSPPVGPLIFGRRARVPAAPSL